MKKLIKISSLFLTFFLININVNIKNINADEMSPWAKADIEKAVSLNLVPSELQNKYTDDITRKEFCELVVKLLEVKNVDMTTETNNIEKFTDTDNKSVIKAAQLGIVSDVGNRKFNPDGKITRQEAAVMLYET